MIASEFSPLVPCEIGFDVDDTRPRLQVTLKGPLSGREVSRALSDLYLTQPKVIRYDMLFDMWAYEGAVEAEHLVPIIEAYGKAKPDPLHPCRTAFWIQDENFGLWAAAMSYQFFGREHRAFQDAREAEAFLAEPMAQRPPFG